MATVTDPDATWAADLRPFLLHVSNRFTLGRSRRDRARRDTPGARIDRRHEHRVRREAEARLPDFWLRTVVGSAFARSHQESFDLVREEARASRTVRQTLHDISGFGRYIAIATFLMMLCWLMTEFLDGVTKPSRILARA